MSLQPMVVAARGCTVDQFVQAFPSVDEGSINVGTGWRWFLHPGLGLEPEQAEDALRSLPGVGLLVVAHEDAQWTLSLIERGREPFDVTHAFGILLPVDEDPLGPIPEDGYEDDWDVLRRQEPPAPFGSNDLLIQMRDLYLSLPDHMTGEFPTDDPECFRDALLASQTDRLIEALARFGVPHQAELVRGTLRGVSVAPAELATRLGNAPRLLATLGFGPHMESYVAEATTGSGLDASVDEAPAPSHVVAGLGELADVPLGCIEGGPLGLPLRRFHHVIRAHMWCDEDGVARIDLLYPEGSDPPALPSLHALCSTRDGRREQLDFDLPNVLLSVQGRAFRKALSMVPDGTQLGIALGPSWDGGIGPTRWRGPIQGGVWLIREGNVPVTPRRWREFTGLLDRIYVDAPIPCEEPDEREHVLARLGPATAEFPDAIEPTVGGIKAAPFFRDEVVAHLFRRRFGDLWPTATAAALEAQAAGVESDLLRGLGEDPITVARAAAAGVILEGDYCEVSVVDTDSLTPAEGEAMDEERAAWTAAGLTHLGDLVVSTAPSAYCMAFVSDGGTAYGAAYVDGMGTLERWIMARGLSGRLASHPCGLHAPIEQGLREAEADEPTALAATLADFAALLDEWVRYSLEGQDE